MPPKHLLIFFTYLASAFSQHQHPYAELTSKPHFVDKSELLTALFGNFSYPHTYFTCPKHFGSTTNLQMIDLFANIELDSSLQPKNYTTTLSYAIFNQSKFGHRDRYRYSLETNLAQHPVIYLDLGSNLPKNFSIQSMLKYLLHALQKTYKRYDWLLRLPESHLNRGPNRVISKEEVGYVDKVLKGRVNQAQVEDGLKTLSRILYKYFDRKVIILIDSFDHAFNNALFFSKTELQSDSEIFEAFKILTRLISNAFRFLSYTMSFMTGLSQAPLTLDHNLGCVAHHNFLDYHEFVGYFGYTEEELDRLLIKNHCSMPERNEVVRYYNGHRICDCETKLFSPHSITQYLQHRLNNSELFRAGLKPYFFGPEKNSVILKYISLPFFRNQLISLVNREVIQFCPILVFEQIHFDRYHLLRNNNYSFINQFTESMASNMLLTMIMKMGYLCYHHDRNFTLPNTEIEDYVNDALNLFYAAENDTLYEIGSLIYAIIGTENETQKDTHLTQLKSEFKNLFTRLSTINDYTRICELEYKYVTNRAIKKYQKDSHDKGSVWTSGSQLDSIIITSKANNKTTAGVLQISCSQGAEDLMAKAMANIRPRVSNAPITYFGINVDREMNVSIETSTTKG